jgi:hypothetical protein
MTCVSATNCTSCLSGYGQVGLLCVANPPNCAAIDSTGICTSCFANYLLTAGACVGDTSCSASSSCTGCPEGFYLSAGKCIQCVLAANCKSCDPNTPANCIGCVDGYYLSAGVCTVCTTGCKVCASAIYCNTPSDGYVVLSTP